MRTLVLALGCIVGRWKWLEEADGNGSRNDRLEDRCAAQRLSRSDASVRVGTLGGD